MAAVRVDDDGWECECGEWNDESDFEIEECNLCGKYWE